MIKNKTLIFVLIIFLFMFNIFSYIGISKEPLSIKENDFSLKTYNRKPNIDNRHIMNIEYDKKFSFSKSDISYKIVGNKNDVENFSRCVDVTYSVNDSMIFFTGSVKEWGCYHVDIQPIVKNLILSKYAWWDSNWGNCKLITLDKNQIKGTHNNFPVCLNFTDIDLKNDAQADGGDIVFINYYDNTSKYWHEIEEYNSGTGELVCFVNMTTISSTYHKLWMYYNNPSVVDQDNRLGTWANNTFEAVYHAGANVGDYKDSMGNYDGSNSGIFISDKNFVGDSFYHDGNANDRVQLSGYEFDEFDNDDFTISCWFNPLLATSEKYSLISAGGNGDDFHMTIRDDNNNPDGDNDLCIYLETVDENALYYDDTGSGYNIGTWYQYVIKYDLSDLYTYQDGKNVGVHAGAGGVIDAGTVPIQLFRDKDIFRYEGYLDEVRFYESIMNDNWINLEYNNLANCTDGSFFSIGLAQSPSVPSAGGIPSVSLYNVVNNSIDNDICLKSYSAYVNSTNGSNIYYTIELYDTFLHNVFYSVSGVADNETVYLNISDCLFLGYNYTIWFNITIDNSTFYNYFLVFTTAECCSSLGGKMEITIGMEMFGIFLTLVIFLIAFYTDKVDISGRNIWKPILLLLDSPISLTTGMYYMVIGSTFSIYWWSGVFFVMFSVLLIFGSSFYMITYGR